MKNLKKLFIIFSLYHAIISLIFSNISIFIISELFLLLTCFILNKFKLDTKKLINAILFSYSISLLVLLIIYVVYQCQYGIPYDIVGLDDLTNEETANTLIKNNIYTISQFQNGNSFLMLHNSKMFVLLLSYLIRLSNLISEYSTITFRIINIYLISYCAFLGIWLGRKLKYLNENNEHLYFIALTCFPNVLYLNSHVYRDTLVVLLMLLAIVFLYQLVFENKKKYIFLITPILYFLMYMRKSYIFIILIIFLINIFFKINRKNKIYFIFLSSIGLGLFFILRYDYIINALVSYSGGFDTTEGFFSKINSLPYLPFGVVMRPLIYLLVPYSLSISEFFSAQISLSQFIYSFTTLGTIGLICTYYLLFRSLKQFNCINSIFILIWLTISLTTSGGRHVLLLYPFMFLILFKEFSTTRKENIKLSIKLGLVLNIIIFSIYNMN